MVSNEPRADEDVSSGQDDAVDDALDALDHVDGKRAPPRRRRGHSRPRLRRAHPEGNVVLRAAEASVRAVAEAVARQVCGHKEENLDLACRVAGVTHRGGFKLRVMHIEEISSAMVDRWRAVCLARGYASTISFDVTASEALIVASMIEREAKVDGDRALIARVIYNRLELGMNLEIDATLYYDSSPDTPFAVLRAKDSPYNTYLYGGLPPTPIANPGRASIRAALNPSPNPSSGNALCAVLDDPTVGCNYLYYVLADDDGSHAFAVTFNQHLANIEISRAKGLLD